MTNRSLSHRNKLAVAEEVGPHGSRKYGYQIVDRCIRHGLITADLGPKGYSLTVTDAGRAYAASFNDRRRPAE